MSNIKLICTFGKEKGLLYSDSTKAKEAILMTKGKINKVDPAQRRKAFASDEAEELSYSPMEKTSAAHERNAYVEDEVNEMCGLIAEMSDPTLEKNIKRLAIDETRQVKLKDRPMMTLIEAAEYTSVGRHKLCEISSDPNCDFVLWVGNRRLFKRDKLIEYLTEAYSI
jgi:uncharacterized protein (UPF0147 family)